MKDKKQAERWFSITNAALNNEGKKIVEAYIYGSITSITWWDGDVSAKSFIDSLSAQEPFDVLDLRINSPGGEFFEAQAIYTTLKSKSYEVNVIIDGLAASAASVIAMAGNKISIPHGAMMMIHNALLMTYGNAKKLAEAISLLEKVDDGINKAYQLKTGLDEVKVKELMEAESWMTATECLELGFADELLDFAVVASLSGDTAVFNSREFDISNFNSKPKLPKAVGDKKTTINKEEKNMDVSTIKNEHPDLYNEIFNLGKTAGMTEATNIEQSFAQISNGIDSDFITECRTAGMSAADTALAAVAQGKLKIANSDNGFVAARAAEVNNGVAGAAEVNNVNADSDEVQLEALRNRLQGGKK